MAGKNFNPLPGFGLTMGYTMLYLSLIVLIPIAALFLRVFEAGTAAARFTVKDFEEFPAFINVIKEHTGPVAALVWERLPEATRQQLEQGDPADEKLQQSFLAALNGLLKGASLHDPERFADVGLSERSRWYLERASSSAWANRSLLEDAFSFEIKRKHNWLSLWLAVTSKRAVAAYKLTFGASFVAACINAVFGTMLAWVLVRYQFPGKRFFDALVDFPFALPTAVAGLTLANLFATSGWLGRFLAHPDADGRVHPVTLTWPWFGIIIALTFIGLPFVVRTLQPVLENFEREVEEAAATLGAGRARTFLTIVGPTLLPAIITGFALAFARAIGEYGSVIFIAGNKPFVSEITPLLIVIRLEEYDYNGAMALAVVMLIFSFVLLITINLLERWARHYET